jgi:hypothetical protein
MADHDQLFKDLLRTFFPDFLGFVAPELLPEVLLGDIRFLEQEIFSDWPRGRRWKVDLLARVRGLAAQTVLVHVEIEAVFRKSAARRLERYFHLVKARYGEPIFPILVLLRGGPPGITRQTLEEALGGHCQTFHFTALGLSGCPAWEYLERPEPLAWALAALMRHRHNRRAELKLACIQRVARAGLSELQTFILVNCIETYIQLTPEETVAFERLRSSKENEEVRTMQITWADRMRAEGREVGLEQGIQRGIEKGIERGLEQGIEKGIAQGLQSGLQKGREEGTRELLGKLLRLRFGELSPGTLKRLAAIRSLDRLTRMAEQVLTAQSLAELDLA